MQRTTSSLSMSANKNALLSDAWEPSVIASWTAK